MDLSINDVMALGWKQTKKKIYTKVRITLKRCKSEAEEDITARKDQPADDLYNL